MGIARTGAFCPCMNARCVVFGLDSAPSHRLARGTTPYRTNSVRSGGYVQSGNLRDPRYVLLTGGVE